MKNKFAIMAAAVVATVGLGTSVQALPFISGDVDMIGSATLNSTVLFSATKVTAASGVVDNGSGSYATLGADAVTWKPFTFIPAGPMVVTPLWTLTDAGQVYDFNLATIKATQTTSGGTEFLNISGTGTAQIPGLFQDTKGTWTLTISSASGVSSNFKFGFQSSTTAVPDGGTTLMLLGGALSGLGLIRRKLAV